MKNNSNYYHDEMDVTLLAVYSSYKCQCIATSNTSVSYAGARQYQLPTLDITKFNGDPSSFGAFWVQWSHGFKSILPDPHMRMAYLYNNCGPNIQARLVGYSKMTDGKGGTGQCERDKDED